ncbi:MAG: right-handed parallel beta-helix repeat-containing protein [Planctomycetota bacterium]
MNLPKSLLALSAVLAGAVAAAAEYHVACGAANASDDNAGAANQPWRTLAKAAATAQAGDVVLIHAGRYAESVQVKNAGTPGQPIVFKAFEDDEVLMDGADEIPAGKWQAGADSKNIYAIPAEFDPDQVFVDGKAVYAKIDKTGDHQWKLGVLSDADSNRYQFNPQTKTLLLNLGGGQPAQHAIRVPVRPTGFGLNAHCLLSGLTARNYAAWSFGAYGDDAVIADCQSLDCGMGFLTGGWDRRGVVFRRNTVIGSLHNGINLQDRPTGCFVEDNLAVRCTLNPSHTDEWSGSIKMNSAADTVFAHNVVLEAGNPETINGHDGWALWGDINIVRIFYVGNTCAHNKEAGLYIEYAMSDTRAYFNTSYRNGHGITCRQSQRGMFLRNLVLESRGSGLAVWAGAPPYSTTDHIFAHNLVRGCNPCLWLQTEHPNFANYNTYWPRQGGEVAWGQAPEGGKTPRYKDLAEWTKATGQDARSEVRDVQPAEVGLDTVTFRVADAKDPAQVLMMVGNGGCEWEDPAGQNILPYFWRPGSGDGAVRTCLYAAYCGLEGGCDGLSYPGAGGTVQLLLDSPAPKEPKLAHGGLRCLQVQGQKPEQMCKEGLGFWSPSLPARAGDSYGLSFFVRGLDLKPAAGGEALAAWVEFTNATGQHRSRAGIAGAQKPLTGTFEWSQIQSVVTVPAGAKRMRVFLGLLPATGKLLLDDISIKVR